MEGRKRQKHANSENMKTGVRKRSFAHDGGGVQTAKPRLYGGGDEEKRTRSLDSACQICGERQTFEDSTLCRECRIGWGVP